MHKHFSKALVATTRTAPKKYYYHYYDDINYYHDYYYCYVLAITCNTEDYSSS